MSVISPCFFLKPVRGRDVAGFDRQIRCIAIFSFHHFIFRIGGETFIEPSFLEFIAGDESVEKLVADLMNDDAFQF
ncbi:hypothetical protein D3C85_837870 [compost metagenome]